MRILLVTPMPPRSEAPGAIPLVLDAQLKGLRERHDVTLVTVVGDEPGELAAAVDLRRSGLETHVIDRRQPAGIARLRRRARLATSWAGGRYPWRTVWFADPQVQRTLDGLTAEREFDIANVEDNSMAVFRLPAHLPAILTEHEVQRPRPIDWRLPAETRQWPRRVFEEADGRRWPSYQRSVWRRFDGLQVFSERDAAAIGQLAPEVAARVHVNPFAVDLPEAADPAGEKPGLLLFVGNFTHPPNVDAACWLVDEVMPRLRERRHDVRLQLVGPAAPAEVRALACDDIEVLGEVPSIEPFLRTAAVVLAPVRSGGGMRMKVLQALASGKAVVTTPIGTDGLVFDRDKLPLRVADGADAIAAATAELLGSEAARRELGALARAYALEHHSPGAYAARLEAVYEAVIARARHAS